MPDSETKRYNEWRRSQGLSPLPEKLKRRTHLIHLSDQAWDGLARIAWRHQMARGRRGNVTQLLEAIGQGVINVE
jgi:hypothetical protein